jgi:hypothetical protein
MMHDTISKIEDRLQHSGALPDNARAELLSLLAQLKVEVSRLSQTHEEQAQSIAAFTEVSTFEATRATKNPKSLEHSIGGLESSVSGFEASHPQLAGVVSRLANLLSNMGI